MAELPGDRDVPVMFEYWCEEKGLKRALKEYYPATLRSRPDLQQALAQLENAERAIRVIFEEITHEKS